MCRTLICVSFQQKKPKWTCHGGGNEYIGRMKKIIAMLPLAALMVLPVLAQTDHFPNQRWKETKTEHFTIRTQGTSPSVAKKYAEKVWGNL